MVKLTFNKENLIPNKRLLINTIYVTISFLLVQFLLDTFGINITGFPKAVNTLIVIGITLWIKSVIDINSNGRDWL